MAQCPRSEMASLNKAQILACAKLPTKTVAVPELGGDVLVRGMRGVENDAFLASLWEGVGANRRQNLDNYRARFVVYCVVDETGKRMFSDDDAAALGQIGAGALERMYDAAATLSGMQPGAIEELAKN